MYEYESDRSLAENASKSANHIIVDKDVLGLVNFYSQFHEIFISHKGPIKHHPGCRRKERQRRLHSVLCKSLFLLSLQSNACIPQELPAILLAGTRLLCSPMVQVATCNPKQLQILPTAFHRILDNPAFFAFEAT